MLELLRLGGQWSWLLLLTAIVVAILAIQSAYRLIRAGAGDASRIRHGIQAIFFWGGVAAVLGFLGQFSGLYLGLQGIADATTLSPSRVAAGIAASCSSSILGLGLLFAACLVGLLLLAWHRRRFGPDGLGRAARGSGR
jgi:hypothetical protein